MQHELDDNLSRTIAFLNDKGGVGKTSLADNLAGQYAAAGYKVLLIDLNKQANVADDLAYRDNPAIDDKGLGLFQALTAGTPLKPVQGIRPNLDVVPGGIHIDDLTAVLAGRSDSDNGRTTLRDSLAPIADQYDIVIIDSPPEAKNLSNLALCAARWIIMPTRSDPGGLVGMGLVASRFVRAREVNPHLQLLGIVLFGTASNASAIRREVHADIQKAFGGQESPMLTASVRYAERVARDMRKTGRLAHELEEDVKALPPRWEALRQGKKPSSMSPTTGKVSEDYAEIGAEILQIMAAAEPAN
ncbi:ParA family protein [Natronoglycomyces albus]|uniref:ParA family protein n=1 Tax=Natronoglycomyces albus TaxID=2811108 RepID=A0A895XPT0_9ACTN|nr:ParA family protein [Natronoglycomyces albus]QSB07177.1 ParA family protein [Natronoglycomyces albus]